MAVFKIPCTWEMYGELEVEAGNIQEALEKAEDDDSGLPEDGYYVDGSFMIDEALALDMSIFNGDKEK